MHNRSGTDTIIEYYTQSIDTNPQHGATRGCVMLDMIMNVTVIHMSQHGSLIGLTQQRPALRLRGSGDPNNDSKYNEIPYLSNIRFEWDGLPCLDFNEKIMYPLNNGLGSMNIKGATLLQAVQETDPGGRLGIPPRAAAPPDVLVDNQQRIMKAYSCILNYMNIRSEVYKMFMRDFQTDGVAVHQFIIVYGPIRTPPKIIQARDDAWGRMTMDALRLPYTVKGYLMWVEVVLAQARYLQKNGDLQKEKFMMGLPKFFEGEISQMRKDGRFVFPATYGLMPGFAAAPNAAVIHPQAGRCNIMALARSYLPDWITKSHHIAKQVPTGLVRSAEAEHFSGEFVHMIDYMPEPIVELLAKDITGDTKCFVCGGEGHAATQDLDNGEQLICPTKVLGTRSKSSAGSSRSHSGKDYKKHANKLTLQIDELKLELEEAYKLHDTSTRSGRRRFTPKPKAHEASDFDTSQSQSELDEDAQQLEDDDSDQSEGSVVRSFAEVAQPSPGRKSPMPRRKQR